MSAVGHNSAPGERIDAYQIAEELGKRGADWGDTDSAYRALDDATKSILSEIIVDFMGTCKSVAEAETRARASKVYREHLAVLASARRKANLARVRYDTYRAFIELRRTNAATDRALMAVT